MTHAHSAVHADDEALLAWLDGEGSAAERRALRRHLRACAGCRARAGQLRGLSRAVLRRIDALDDPPAAAYLPASLAEVRRRRAAPLPSRPLMRWAAAFAAIVTTGAVLASPLPRQLREWIAGDSHGAQTPQAPAPIGPRQTPERGAQQPQEFRFIPQAGEFHLTFAAAAEGELVIYGADGREAVFTVRTADPAPHPVLLLPDGLRVSNRPGTPVDYTLSLPRGISRVRLRIGGGPARSTPIARISPEGLRIPLRTGDLTP